VLSCWLRFCLPINFQLVGIEDLKEMMRNTCCPSAMMNHSEQKCRNSVMEERTEDGDEERGKSSFYDDVTKVEDGLEVRMERKSE